QDSPASPRVARLATAEPRRGEGLRGRWAVARGRSQASKPGPPSVHCLPELWSDAPAIVLDLLDEDDRRRVGPELREAVNAGRSWLGSLTAAPRDGPPPPEPLATARLRGGEARDAGRRGRVL